VKKKEQLKAKPFFLGGGACTHSSSSVRVGGKIFESEQKEMVMVMVMVMNCAKKTKQQRW